MKTHRPLSRIAALPEEQRRQIAEWLQTETLDKTSRLITEEFGLVIPRSNLHRFKQRCEINDFLDDSEDSDTARAELVNAAATAKPDFSAATVKLLERQMFELAQDHSEAARHKALGDVIGWVHKHKITVVRQRMTDVQEGKLKLRQQELEAKKPSEKSVDSKIQELNEKISIAFRSHPLLTAIHKAEDALTHQERNEYFLPSPAVPPTEKIPDDFINTGLQSGEIPGKDNSATVSTISHPCPSGQSAASLMNTGIHPGDSTKPSAPSVLTLSQPPESNAPPTGNNEEPSCSAPVPECQMENAQCSMLNEKRRPIAITSAPPENNHSHLPTLNSQLPKSHSLRRWAAHIPRTYHSPEPDPSWRNECPCGAPAPCNQHPDLSRQVRYTKPWNPDYADALRARNIPIYTPSEDELHQFLRAAGVTPLQPGTLAPQIFPFPPPP